MAGHPARSFPPNTTHHVYNRGRGKQLMFRDAEDYRRFLALLERLLTPGTKVDARGHRVTPMVGEVAVLAYALMPNHFHLVVHQYASADAVARLVARLMTSYTRYFNRRHGRSGPLCEDRFRSKPLAAAADVKNAIAYVHRNPADPLDAGALTSHALYSGRHAARDGHWCSAGLGLRTFGSRSAYLERLHDAIAVRDRDQPSG